MSKESNLNIKVLREALRKTWEALKHFCKKRPSLQWCCENLITREGCPNTQLDCLVRKIPPKGEKCDSFFVHSKNSRDSFNYSTIVFDITYNLLTFINFALCLVTSWSHPKRWHTGWHWADMTLMPLPLCDINTCVAGERVQARGNGNRRLSSFLWISKYLLCQLLF